MAETLQGQVRYPNADGTIFGPGCVRERLQEILAELGVQRPFLLTTPSLTRTDLLPAVRNILGDAQVGEFAASRAHTPRPTVLDAAQQARAAGADGLISFGGSSVVDLTKGVALVLAEGDDCATQLAALPRRLRDVEVPETALDGIAEHVLHDFVVGTNPRRVERREEVMEILTAAW